MCSLDSRPLIAFRVCYWRLSAWGPELKDESERSHYKAEKKEKAVRDIGQTTGLMKQTVWNVIKKKESTGACLGSLPCCGTKPHPSVQVHFIELGQIGCFCMLRNSFHRCYHYNEGNWACGSHTFLNCNTATMFHRLGGGGVFGFWPVSFDLHTLHSRHHSLMQVNLGLICPQYLFPELCRLF